MMSLRPLIFALCTSATLAAPIGAEPVTIFAASSLKTALDNVIETRALDAVPVYGGSAAIARQIAQGAKADIVILAHPDWMEWLSTQGALQKTSRCNLLRNALVLAASANAPDLDVQSADDLITALNGERLSVGQLRAVPAGQYTRAYLSEQGWLDALRPHLAETSNVRLALALLRAVKCRLALCMPAMSLPSHVCVPSLRLMPWRILQFVTPWRSPPTRAREA